MRDVVYVKRNRAETAGVFATMRQTTAARRSNFVTVYGAFVAGYIYNLNDVLIVFIAAHGEFDALGKYRPFLIYAAAHGRNFAGNDYLGNVYGVFSQSTRPRLTRDFAQDFVFKVLNLRIEFFNRSHRLPL